MLYFVTYTTYSQSTPTVTAVVQQLVNWTVDVVVTYEPSSSIHGFDSRTVQTLFFLVDQLFL